MFKGHARIVWCLLTALGFCAGVLGCGGGEMSAPLTPEAKKAAWQWKMDVSKSSKGKAGARRPRR
jgi:hypothetical protein